MINVFVFGLFAYLVTCLLYLIPWVSAVASFDLTAVALGDEAAPRNLQRSVVDDILVATAVSIMLAPAWLKIQRHVLVIRSLQRIGATKRYGDEDVWDFLPSSYDPRTR